MTDTALGARSGPNWKAAVLAGLIAAVVFMMMEMALVAATGGSPWGPPRMIAAMVLGKEALPPPATFDPMIMMVAMGIHGVLSVLLALLFVLAASRLNLVLSLVLGAVFGLVIYLVNFHGFTALFPWFAMARGAVSIMSHIMFGVVLALAYKLMAR